VNAPTICSTTQEPAFKTFLTAPVINSSNTSKAPSITFVAAQNKPSKSFWARAIKGVNSLMISPVPKSRVLRYSTNFSIPFLTNPDNASLKEPTILFTNPVIVFPIKLTTDFISFGRFSIALPT